MTAKKKFITRIASWTAVVLAIALVVGGATLVIEASDREGFKRAQKNLRAEIFEETRIYVDEIAAKIDTAPVDPTLVSEIESRYFEDYDRGPMAVWAMGTDGAFLFGVPRESFNRMNAIYDREITPRLQDGIFYDRQSFFLGHLDDAGETLMLGDLTVDDPDSEDFSSERNRELWEHLGNYSNYSEDGFVLSAPIKTSDGAALGSVYLRRSRPSRDYFDMNENLQKVQAGAGGVAGLAFLFLWILLPTWVYVDARENGAPRAPLFAFLTAVSSLVGLLVYLIARPEKDRSLVCPGCDHEVNGGAFCPHCGRDLTASICQTCRYPLEPDWSFCPSCRTAIEPPSSPDSEVEPPPQETPLPEPG